ncbi:hypothetical protein PALB_22810 [Pseudoalteromonas luteoviolacea B = ATCC 29581]|nr:hypothetical protein PALB_22810 [Pseudoalteromonas luteoviolacea B = ATCC 29581]
MKQRLVIRTNVKPTAINSPTVSYEWHWRRIWAAIITCCLLFGAGGYMLLLSVNADELNPNDVVSQQQNERSEPLMSAEHIEVTQEESTPIKNYDIAPNMTTIESTASEQQSALRVDDVKNTKAPVDEPTLDTSLEEAALTSRPIQQIEAPNTEFLRRATEVQSVSSPDGSMKVDDGSDEDSPFPNTAIVANVALGAKIDTASISRAVLTTGVVKLEPIDVLKSDVSVHQFEGKLYFFTEVKELAGSSIRHLWYYEDSLIADIKLSINSARYRTYSLKNIQHKQVGDWRVEAVNAEGGLIARKEFRVH